MKSFVFWTGLISVLAGASLQVPEISSTLMRTESSGMLMHLFGLMAVFIGIMLMLCSRDLKRRGTLVLWEGLLRVGGFGIMAGYGLLGGAGPSVAATGLFDLAVGMIYLIALPKYLGVGLVDLLLDRSAAAQIK